MTRGLPRRALLVLILAGLCIAPPAEARSVSTVQYPMADVWPTAVRFLRIDRNCVIREKDETAGYILFDYPEGQKLHKGSLELIRASDGDGRNITRVVATLPDLPHYLEQLLLDKLAAKLRDDHGSPAPAPSRKPEPAEPDAGASR
ncbi:MAG: hypothetical protein WCG85_19495 [Polyangia bacterium]